MAAVVLPVLTAAQAANAADAASMCQQLRATGATDIAKATLLLRAKLPRVSAAAAAAFERETVAGVPDARAGVGSSLYHVWLAGRYLDRAMRQIGTIFQLVLAARTVLDNLATMLVLHLLPAFAFVARAHAADTKTGFAVELADVDTG